MSTDKQQPGKLRIALWMLYDALWIGLATVIFGLATLAGGSLVYGAKLVGGWPLVAFSLMPAYIVFLLVVIAQMAFIRKLIPPPQPGIYRKFSKGNFFSLVWLTGLNNILFAMPFLRTVNFVAVLRYCYYRGMGMQTHFGNWISVDAVIIDPGLVRLGRNVNIGGLAALTCHVALHDAMVILPVTIGDNVMVGAVSKIGPGVTIGDNALIGADCKLGMKVKVGEGAYVEPFSVVEAGTVIGPYEKWGGSPAVKVGNRPRPKPPVEAAPEPAPEEVPADA